MVGLSTSPRIHLPQFCTDLKKADIYNSTVFFDVLGYAISPTTVNLLEDSFRLQILVVPFIIDENILPLRVFH